MHVSFLSKTLILVSFTPCRKRGLVAPTEYYHPSKQAVGTFEDEGSASSSLAVSSRIAQKLSDIPATPFTGLLKSVGESFRERREQGCRVSRRAKHGQPEYFMKYRG